MRAYSNNFSKEASFYLFYGNNDSLVSSCLTELKNKLNCPVISFDFIVQKKENFSAVLEELQSSDLFYKKKIILLRDTKDNKDLIAFFTNKQKRDLPSNILVMTCQNTANVRKTLSVFNSAKSSWKNTCFISVSCYEQSQRSFVNICLAQIKKYNLEISSSALQIFTSSLTTSYGSKENALQTLIFLCLQKNKITTSDVYTVLKQLDPQQNIYKTVTAIMMGKKIALVDLQSIAETKAVVLLNYLHISFFRLFRLKEYMKQNNCSAEIAIKNSKHPIFFKDIPDEKQKLTMWEIKKIVTVLKMLISKQILIKRTGTLPLNLLNLTVFEISKILRT